MCGYRMVLICGFGSSRFAPFHHGLSARVGSAPHRSRSASVTSYHTPSSSWPPSMRATGHQQDGFHQCHVILSKRGQPRRHLALAMPSVAWAATRTETAPSASSQSALLCASECELPVDLRLSTRAARTDATERAHQSNKSLSVQSSRAYKAIRRVDCPGGLDERVSEQLTHPTL